MLSYFAHEHEGMYFPIELGIQQCLDKVSTKWFHYIRNHSLWNKNCLHFQNRKCCSIIIETEMRSNVSGTLCVSKVYIFVKQLDGQPNIVICSVNEISVENDELLDVLFQTPFFLQKGV